jgi:hypothetical protein
MTIHSDVQRMLESGKFEPKDCIQNIHDHGPVHFPEAARHGIVIISSLSCQLHRCFPQYVTDDNENAEDVSDAKERKRPAQQRPAQQRVRTEVDSDDDDADGRKAFVASIDDVHVRVAGQIIRRCALSKDVVEYILNADKREWVPAEKHKEQAKRIAHRELYPAETTMGANGIVLPGEATESPFQLERLLMSRALREPLHLALMERMQKDIQLRHLHVTVDLVHAAPVQLHEGKATPMVPDEWPRVGEDDVLMILYARRRRQHILFIDSLDRDSMALLLLHHHTFTRDVVLWFGDGRYVRPAEMATKLEAAGWTIAMFVQCMIMSGTDFVEKGRVEDGRLVGVTRNIGVVHLFAAGFALLDAYPDYVDLLQDKAAFVLWLRLLYSTALKFDHMATPNEIRAYIDEKQYKKWQWPNDDEINDSYRQLHFNFHYWQSLHGRLYKVEKLPEAASPHRH